jgi:hypothetical protein
MISSNVKFIVNLSSVCPINEASNSATLPRGVIAISEIECCNNTFMKQLLSSSLWASAHLLVSLSYLGVRAHRAVTAETVVGVKAGGIGGV